MKKFLFLLLIAAGVCYYYNPPLEDHISALVADAPQDMFSSESLRDKVKENLDFTNFVVASATKDKLRLSIVTFGFLGKVRIVSHKWMGELLKPPSEKGSGRFDSSGIDIPIRS